MADAPGAHDVRLAGSPAEIELPEDHLDLLDPASRSQPLSVDRIYIAVSSGEHFNNTRWCMISARRTGHNRLMPSRMHANHHSCLTACMHTISCRAWSGRGHR